MGRTRLLAGLLLALIPVTAAAQATLGGVVRESFTMNGLPGVAVEAQNAATQQKAATVSDSQGSFTFTNLAAGTYTLTFSHDAFQIETLKNVSLAAETTHSVSVIAFDEGCGRARPTVTCLTYREVAAGVPEVFRPLWRVGNVASAQSAFPCETVSLSKFGGLLFLPGSSYKLVLHRDGRAELASQERPTPAEATDYVGTVNVWDFGKLCYLTQHLGFDRLASLYNATWTDDVSITVTVDSHDRTVTVAEYAGIGPIELWALQMAVEAIKHDIVWTRK